MLYHCIMQLLTWSGHKIVLFNFHKLTNFHTFTFTFHEYYQYQVFSLKICDQNPQSWDDASTPSPPNLSPGYLAVIHLHLWRCWSAWVAHETLQVIPNQPQYLYTVCIWWAPVHSCWLLSEYLVSMVSYTYHHSTRLLPLTLLQVCSTSNNTDGNKQVIFFPV